MAGRDAMNAVVAIMGAATLLAVSAPAMAGDRTRGIEFLPMSRDQVFNAGAAGTGCSFLSNGGKIVFAAADDRAVVRLPIGIVRLKPAPHAADLFPFTYDRWTTPGLSVTVRVTGRAVHRGSESSRSAAVLEITSGKVATSRRGLLDCGS